MDPIPDKEQWRAAYLKRVEMLETIRIRELAAMTEEEALRRVLALRVVGRPWRERPDWSGLVEQQALFHRKKKR
ncbi:MAG: hypothetical protein NTW19_06610 [Planctomycetota bacterium]|nr:hypothetical protein [Planctomycetota bacterium]